MRRLKAGEPRRIEPLERLLPSAHETAVQLRSRDNPEANAARAEVVDAILAAVAELPLHFRLPFVLKEMVGLTIAEVSEVLGIKGATIKTRLHRARLQVRSAVVGALPSHQVRGGGSMDRPREECLALLRAKQEAMDRSVEFPLPLDHLCERCRAVIETLDYAAGTCRTLGAGRMPGGLRRSLAAALGDP